jgi:hypothetical protein
VLVGLVGWGEPHGDTVRVEQALDVDDGVGCKR